VDLAEGDVQAALGSLRRAFEVWQGIQAPYAAARVRVLIGLACRALGEFARRDCALSQPASLGSIINARSLFWREGCPAQAVALLV
jgi:hypothetical protein